MTSAVTAVSGQLSWSVWRVAGPGAGRGSSEEVIAFTSDNEPYSVQAVIEPQWGSAGINMIISVGVQHYR